MSTIVTTGEAGEAPPAKPPTSVPVVTASATDPPRLEGAWVMAFLACLTGVAFVALVFSLLWVQPKENVQLLTAMAGILGSQFAMLMGFFFGNARKANGG